MGAIESQFFALGETDRLARQNTPLHRLDGRAKLLATLAFLATVVSFGRYELSALMPFVVFPVALCLGGNVPGRWLWRKILFAAPFAVLIGIFNPLFDRQPLLAIGGLPISGGWISFASILLRFTLTVAAALALTAVTGFNNVCLALRRLGVPRAFVVQLLFLHRYLFVLVEETMRLVRARALRSCGRGTSLHEFGSLTGHLLLRTLDRAQRVHQAMSCRGFAGAMPALRPARFGGREIVFVLGWTSLFVALRWVNASRWLGATVLGWWS